MAKRFKFEFLCEHCYIPFNHYPLRNDGNHLIAFCSTDCLIAYRKTIKRNK